MIDDPRRNLKWLEQELMSEEDTFRVSPKAEYEEDRDLLELVDMLLEDEAEEEDPPVRNFANNYGRESRAARAERAGTVQHMDKTAAVFTKSKKQLRREEKQRKKAEKKAGVNRSLKGLVCLAILECLGILAIIGWWLQ